MTRLSWDDYFFKMALLVAERATCERLSVGAIIVRDNRIIATGYNGAPSGMRHCTDGGCYTVDGHCASSIHAEVNAILECARYGIPTNGATLYCTHEPCYNCAKTIAQAGIKHVKYLFPYKEDKRVFEMFESLGIKCN